MTHDPVNHPTHYTDHPSGVEVITYTRLLPFNHGNAVKYIMRRDLKGRPVEDIEKAVWYLRDAVEHELTYKITPLMKTIIVSVIHHEPNDIVAQFLATMYLSNKRWAAPDLDTAVDILLALRRSYY